MLTTHFSSSIIKVTKLVKCHYFGNSIREIHEILINKYGGKRDVGLVQKYISNSAEVLLFKFNFFYVRNFLIFCDGTKNQFFFKKSLPAIDRRIRVYQYMMKMVPLFHHSFQVTFLLLSINALNISNYMTISKQFEFLDYYNF